LYNAIAIVETLFSGSHALICKVTWSISGSTLIIILVFVDIFKFTFVKITFCRIYGSVFSQDLITQMIVDILSARGTRRNTTNNFYSRRYSWPKAVAQCNVSWKTPLRIRYQSVRTGGNQPFVTWTRISSADCAMVIWSMRQLSPSVSTPVSIDRLYVVCSLPIVPLCCVVTNLCRLLYLPSIFQEHPWKHYATTKITTASSWNMQLLNVPTLYTSLATCLDGWTTRLQYYMHGVNYPAKCECMHICNLK
jgi:hypothetical protein